MKAVRFYGPLDLRIEDVDVPRAGIEEIVVSVDVSGLCPSDVRIFRNGSSSVKPPVIMGHEFAGHVYEVGKNVEGVHEKDGVSIPADAYCGKCRMCRSGHENDCENGMAFGYNIDGAHSDYVLIPKRFIQREGIFHLKSDADYEEASMTEPLACTVNTIETLETKPGKKVVVIGDGPMGLMHVAVAKEYGASEIILCGLVDWKLKLGDGLGATKLVNVKVDEPVEKVREATRDAGADIVVVTAVTPRTIIQGLQMASKRGYVSIFGGTPKGVSVQIEPNWIHYNELFLTGHSGYTYAHYFKAAEMVASHRVPLKKLVSHRFKLEQIRDAIATWDDKEKSMKIMLTR